MFTVAELQEDFVYWRNRIEQKHPLVYLYTPQSEIDRCFDSLYQQIDRPMTELAFIKLLTPTTAFIQDGHNYVIPSKTTLASMRSHKRLLPLELRYLDKRLYVTQDLSTSEVPLIGLEITSINGVYSQDLLQVFLSNLGRDGYNYQYAYASINNSFRFYFHLHFGFPEAFLITYRTKDEQESSCVISGRSLSAIQEEKQNRYPLKEEDTQTGLTFNILDSIHTAVLGIQTFSPSTSNRKFRREISSYFEAIKRDNVSNLILDLRDNNGGNPDLVKFILQHLFGQPFEQARECRIVKDPSEEHFLERTRSRWYPWYGIGTFRPKRNNFKGNLYLLVNEGTFSSGVIFSNVLRRYARTVVVGSETGGNPIVMSGYLIKTSWTLPNTRIQIGSGILCTVYDDDLKLNQGRGLIPDHLVEPSLEDILSRNDRCLQYTLKLIALL